MSEIRCRFASALAIVILTLVTQAPLPAARQTGPAANPERLARIFEALGARPGATIADVGAGGGDYTFQIAGLVGNTGRVVAVDVSAEAIEKLRALVAWRKVEHITVVEGAVDDPRLEPRSLDGALIVNAYHEMVEHEAMLARIKAALKPGGRLVIVDQVSDSRRDATRAEQTDRHELAPGFAREDLRRAGFIEVSFVNDFTKRENQREWLIVASPDPGAGRSGDAAAGGLDTGRRSVE